MNTQCNGTHLPVKLSLKRTRRFTCPKCRKQFTIAQLARGSKARNGETHYLPIHAVTL